GGICNYGTLTVTNSTISGNTAPDNDGGGGGICNFGTLTVTNSTISGNTASDAGGGIYNEDGMLTVTNSTISGNTATWDGGGIYNQGDTLTVTNSTISGNTVSYGGGGGIYSYGTLLTVTNSTISENTAYYGGGICNFGTLTVMNSTISGNTATYGGGIYSYGTLTVTNGTISGNTASDGDGGGIWNSGKATVVNSIVSGNYAGGNGGGVFFVSGSGEEQTFLVNSTVAGNQSKSDGGGVYNYEGTVIANNTIIAMNVGSVAPDIWTGNDTTATQTIINHSLIGNGDYGDGRKIEGDDSNRIGSGVYPVDPLFKSFETYTTWSESLWKSWNLRPIATSPVIDSGSDDLAVDGDGEELITDRDGNSRISGNGVDIGAYELPRSPSLFPGLKQPARGYAVAENAKLNSNVGSVTPITQAARGQAYSYALTSGSEYFAIDSKGKITTTGVVDYETTPTVDIVVETSVNGVPTWSDTFTINIKDVNEVPVDIGISQNGSVVSDIDFGEGSMVVGTLAATDPDGTAITGYKLGGSDAKLFEVVRNGNVFEFRAKSPLDFENPLSKDKTNRYEVEIQATDSTRKAGKSKLAIHVIDRNYTSAETVEIASSGNAWVLKQVGSNVQILNGKTVLLSEPASAFPSLTIHGNAKKDTLMWNLADWNSSTEIDVMFDGQGDADTVKITGTDARETFFFISHGVTVNGTSIGLTNVEMLTVDGGNGDDTYCFTGLVATTSTTVSDKKGVDTFDFSDAQSGVTLDIGNTKPQSLFGCTLVVKTAPEILIGTEYADTLTGNKSGSVIYGGAGSDTIRAVGGKNVLIGGMAADVIYGSDGEDLLIGGDIDRDLLPELYQEWVASKSKWAARCDQLRQGIFSSEAIENDDDCDTLYGGKGQDWFFGEDEEIQDFDETSRTPDRKK
ncbi:MAG: right-handed parallel beta-helix repeat-containing protein, partial [Thermoguttaceae bacterium]|nr:right-handed parallel beta-helix repeat-containing protein [Thermoguttaceae bacterium]